MRLLPALALLGAASPPPRIVSINPCVDAVLMRLGVPAQIAAISHYSQDRRATSIPLAQANRFRATSGTAEEVVALRPDMVLSGPHVAPATIAALRRLNIRLVQYPVAETVAESVAQVRDIARIVHAAPAGERLAARIAAAARPSRLPPVPALIWSNGGLVPGKDTLPDALLTRAGFRNVSGAIGLKRWDVLGLEPLIADPPRVLFSIGAAEAGHDRLADHPAMARLRRHIAVVPYPARLMNCGGPAIIDAMARLRAARARVA